MPKFVFDPKAVAVRKEVRAQDKKASDLDPPAVHRESGPVPVRPVPASNWGQVRFAVVVRPSLAFSSMECTVDVSLPVADLTSAMVPAVVEELKKVIEDEVAGYLPEIQAALVTLGEWRQTTEAGMRGRGR